MGTERWDAFTQSEANNGSHLGRRRDTVTREADDEHRRGSVSGGNPASRQAEAK